MVLFLCKNYIGLYFLQFLRFYFEIFPLKFHLHICFTGKLGALPWQQTCALSQALSQRYRHLVRGRLAPSCLKNRCRAAASLCCNWQKYLSCLTAAHTRCFYPSVNLYNSEQLRHEEDT